MIYSLGFSSRASCPYRLGIGSFVEDVRNEIEIIQLNLDTELFESKVKFDHIYPATKLIWLPERVTTILFRMAPSPICWPPQGRTLRFGKSSITRKSNWSQTLSTKTNSRPRSHLLTGTLLPLTLWAPALLTPPAVFGTSRRRQSSHSLLPMIKKCTTYISPNRRTYLHQAEPMAASGSSIWGHLSTPLSSTKWKTFPFWRSPGIEMTRTTWQLLKWTRTTSLYWMSGNRPFNLANHCNRWAN